MPLMMADEPTTQDDMDLLMNLDEDDDDQIWSKVTDDQEELLNYASSGRDQVLLLKMNADEHHTEEGP